MTLFSIRIHLNIDTKKNFTMSSWHNTHLTNHWDLYLLVMNSNLRLKVTCSNMKNISLKSMSEPINLVPVEGAKLVLVKNTKSANSVKNKDPNEILMIK